MEKPTIHVIGMPHIQTSKAYCRDAYGMKILHFCQMMHKEGYKIMLYASEDNETPAELFTCITKAQQAKLGFEGPEDYLNIQFDVTKPIWQIFQSRVTYFLNKNVSPGDIIGTFSGLCDKSIADAFPQCYFVELGIGYSGVFSGFRIFESYAWMHTIYGASTGNASATDGKFYDTVIPNYFNPDDFPFKSEKEDYFLFVGRMIYRKGIVIINDMAKRMPNTKFIFAGQGAVQYKNKIGCSDGTVLEGDNLEYIGTINIEQRGKLMSGAKALIVPTIYIGPFEGVHAEAMFCGTPVITTNFGCFTETNIDGVTGYRCSTIKQFVEAASKVSSLDPMKIRAHALSKFSMDSVAPQYTKYFEQIQGLANGGFYEM